MSQVGSQKSHRVDRAQDYGWSLEVGKRKVGTKAMKRIAAGADLPTPWLFEPAKRPDDRADYCTTAWIAVSSPSARARYTFLQSSGLGRALWAKW